MSEGAAAAHTVIVDAVGTPGALERVVGLLRRRRVPVDELAIAAAAGRVRVTARVAGADVEQLRRQLVRLEDVRAVHDLGPAPDVLRETALVCVVASADADAVVSALCQGGRARLVDVTTGTRVVEVTDAPAAVDRVIDLLRPAGVLAVSRTGPIALPPTGAGAGPVADHPPDDDAAGDAPDDATHDAARASELARRTA